MLSSSQITTTPTVKEELHHSNNNRLARSGWRSAETTAAAVEIIAQDTDAFNGDQSNAEAGPARRVINALAYTIVVYPTGGSIVGHTIVRPIISVQAAIDVYRKTRLIAVQATATAPAGINALATEKGVWSLTRSIAARSAVTRVKSAAADASVLRETKWTAAKENPVRKVRCAFVEARNV